MTKLGKRYIAVHRLDRPEDNVMVDGHMREVRQVADGSYADWRSPTREHIRTVVVDLDSLPPADASEHEQHESQYLYHYERTVETGRALNITISRDAEVERLRQRVAAMEAVVGAACVVADGRKSDSTEWNRLVAGLFKSVDAYRSGQPATASEPSDDGAPGTLTPAQWSALAELRDDLDGSPRGVRWATALNAAIDRLRETAPSNRNRLDEDDLRRLREAATWWLQYSNNSESYALGDILRSLLDAGKLGP